MPKGIGYKEASQMGIFGRKKKKNKDTARTKQIEEQLRNAGFTEEEIKRLRGKSKKKE